LSSESIHVTDGGWLTAVLSVVYKLELDWMNPIPNENAELLTFSIQKFTLVLGCV
jgi:hypothetical protein